MNSIMHLNAERNAANWVKKGWVLMIGYADYAFVCAPQEKRITRSMFWIEMEQLLTFTLDLLICRLSFIPVKIK